MVEQQNKSENRLSPLTLLPVGHTFDSSPLSRLFQRAGLERITKEEIPQLVEVTLRALLNVSPEGLLSADRKKLALFKYFFGPGLSIEESGQVGQQSDIKLNKTPGLGKFAGEINYTRQSLDDEIMKLLKEVVSPAVQSLLQNRSSEKGIPITALQGGIFKVTDIHRIDYQ